jgi:membrane protein implicated in regulation of membrane protease activity
VQRDERLDLPSLYPLLAFVAALTFGPALAEPRLALAGVAVIAVLLIPLRQPRLALIAVLIVAGISIALQREERLARERSEILSLGEHRFVTVEAPIRSGWRAISQEQFRLIAERFTVIDGNRLYQVVGDGRLLSFVINKLP